MAPDGTVAEDGGTPAPPVRAAAPALVAIEDMREDIVVMPNRSATAQPVKPPPDGAAEQSEPGEQPKALEWPKPAERPTPRASAVRLDVRDGPHRSGDAHPEGDSGMAGAARNWPSKREREERADRAAACQTFGRPGHHRGRRPARRLRQDHHLHPARRRLRQRSRRRCARPGEPRAAGHHASATRRARARTAPSATCSAPSNTAAPAAKSSASATCPPTSATRSPASSTSSCRRPSAAARSPATSSRASTTWCPGSTQMIIVDTANDESAENWRAAIEAADALVVPVKWRNDYSVPAIEMLEELQPPTTPPAATLSVAPSSSPPTVKATSTPLPAAPHALFRRAHPGGDRDHPRPPHRRGQRHPARPAGTGHPPPSRARSRRGRSRCPGGAVMAGAAAGRGAGNG